MQETQKEAKVDPRKELGKEQGGRPVKPIDEEQVRKLARKLWPIEEIANHFNVSGQTIARRYRETIDAGYLEGKSYIRDLQWKKAQEGSERILLHMSAVHLGEHQKITQEVTQKVTVQSNTTVLIEKVRDLFKEKLDWEKELNPPPQLDGNTKSDPIDSPSGTGPSAEGNHPQYLPGFPPLNN